MRTRNRSKDTHAVNIWQVGLESSDYSLDLPLMTETMTDENTGSMKINKPCEHVKVTRNGSVISRSGIGVWSGNPVVTNILDTRWFGQSVVPFKEVAPWADMMKCLISDATGHIPDSGLVTSFAEIGEIKTLIPQGIGLIRKLFSRSRSSKDLASGFLLYSFGAKPLVQDIQSILNLASAVQKRLTALNYRSGKTVTLSQRRVHGISESRGLPDPVYDTRAPGGLSYPTSGNYGVEVSGSISYVMSCDCSSTLRYTDLDATASKLVAEYLGLMSPLVTAWNLVPMSFLVDWFVDVSSRIEKLEARVLPSLKQGAMRNVKLSNPVCSVTTNLKHESKFLWDSFAGNVVGISGPYQGTTMEYDSYSRQIGWPVIAEAPWGFSVNQFLLGISLFEQKRKS